MSYLIAGLVFFSPAIVAACYVWAAPRFYRITNRIHERNRQR